MQFSKRSETKIELSKGNLHEFNLTLTKPTNIHNKQAEKLKSSKMKDER